MQQGQEKVRKISILVSDCCFLNRSFSDEYLRSEMKEFLDILGNCLNDDWNPDLRLQST